MGEGVKARAKQDVLGNSALDGLGEQIFGIAAAGDQERAEADGEWPRLIERVTTGRATQFLGVGAENGHGEGIVQD